MLNTVMLITDFLEFNKVKDMKNNEGAVSYDMLLHYLQIKYLLLIVAIHTIADVRN